MSRGAWQPTVHGIAESDMTEATLHAVKPKLLGQTKRQERGNHDVSSVSDSIQPPLDETRP